ncbi:MAG: response regulator transcription factor [Candidatus Rokubacteria bacterium]|nr:response regulator transcription factor [Candidatus Rokubacteria bacterium]
MWLDISIVVVPGARRDLSTTVHLFRDVTASREIEALVRERLTQSKREASNGNGTPVELTRRELEVLRLLTAGADTKAIAERLHVSPATVRNHVQNIFGKLGVHSRLEAVAHANRNGLL